MGLSPRTVMLISTGAFGDTGSSMTTPLSTTKPPASSGASHLATSAGRWPSGAPLLEVDASSAHLHTFSDELARQNRRRAVIYGATLPTHDATYWYDCILMMASTAYL